MIYLYGITGPLAEPVDGRGLDGAELEAVTLGSLTAVCSRHERLELRADAASCWAHEQAVETVMRRQAVLPARFGTTFVGVAQLREAVSDQTETLLQRLAEIDGCVELAVRITPLDSRDGQTASGRRYLLDLLSAQRRREALAESTLACLRELAVDSRLAAAQTREESVSISYLVESGGVERFSRAVARLQQRWPQLALSCTGPWAPYSFAAGPHPMSRETAA